MEALELRKAVPALDLVSLRLWLLSLVWLLGLSLGGLVASLGRLVDRHAELGREEWTASVRRGAGSVGAVARREERGAERGSAAESEVEHGGGVGVGEGGRG